LTFGTSLKAGVISGQIPAKLTSPSVAHELAITTADEKSLAIFSREYHFW
jgi:hypothetical protein